MENAIISYLGENKPNLITDITTLLTEKNQLQTLFYP